MVKKAWCRKKDGCRDDLGLYSSFHGVPRFSLVFDTLNYSAAETKWAVPSVTRITQSLKINQLFKRSKTNFIS